MTLAIDGDSVPDFKVGSRVRAKVDFHFALSDGIDVPAGTEGIVTEVNKGGSEGFWLHIEFAVGDNRGTTMQNADPSEVQLIN